MHLQAVYQLLLWGGAAQFTQPCWIGKVGAVAEGRGDCARKGLQKLGEEGGKWKSGQLAETFQHDLESIAAHQFNWKHKAGKITEIKENLQNESYTIISKSLWQDEHAVWAHVKPVIEDLQNQNSTQFQSLHIISDNPVRQYQNKTNCFFLSMVSFTWGLKSVTRSYSDRSHGKGAPDRVDADLLWYCCYFLLPVVQSSLLLSVSA